MKKFLSLATGAAMLAAMPMAVQAQDAAAVEVTTGAKVFGPQGGEVGTITAVTGDVATVDTGTQKAGLPLSAFGKSDTGLTITVTQADLNAMVAKQAADAKAALLAKLQPGTEIPGMNGALLGTVKSVEGDLVTIVHEGNPYKLPLQSFVSNGDAVNAAMTVDQFKAAISGS